jgi:hypothetical protein
MRTTVITSLAVLLFASCLAVLLFASCGFRMVENSHRLAWPGPGNRGDSILALDPGETIRLPDSRAVVSDIIVKAPSRFGFGYTRLLAYSRSEAARLGGNLLKINAYSDVFRQKLSATIYLLSPPDLTRLKDSLAAALAAHLDSIRDIAVVHIKDYDDMGQRYIRFNHSLVDSIKGRGFDGLRGAGRKNLVFHMDGVLWLGDNPVAIQKGKEYYLVLSNTFIRRRTVQRLALTDKTHFDHRNMIF